jgi:hypothetical protein
MPQTILSYLLCLIDSHSAPFNIATQLTAARFNVSPAYVEQLFYRGL